MKRFLLLGFPVLVVIAAAIFTTFITGSAKRSAEPQSVRLDGDYYIFPLVVQVREQNPAGEEWDAVDSSAPDISVAIGWKGLQVFKSETKRNTLLARWSLGRIDVTNIALSGGTTSIDDSINAARVHVEGNGSIEITVRDEDLVTSDEIAKWTIQLDKLSVGDNILTEPAPGVSRVILRVLDMKSAVDLLQ